MSYTYDYPRPALTVDAVVFVKENEATKVLLIQRTNPPFESQWALPGGFVDRFETVEEAVLRELKEETGLSGVELRQLHTFSALERDPRGRTVTVAFYGFTSQDNTEVASADDARDAKWFNINELPDLAFDHSEIIEVAIKKIQGL